MSKGPNYAKGEAVRRELIGEGEVTKISETVYDDPMMQKFRDYAIEAVFDVSSHQLCFHVHRGYF